MEDIQIYKRIHRYPNLIEQLNALEVGEICEIFNKDYKVYVVRLRCSQIKKENGKCFSVTERNLIDKCFVKRVK